MKRKVLCLTLIMFLLALRINAQERLVENIPYADLKTFHFGVVIGTHVQDTQFKNIGEQTIANESGIGIKKDIVCDQDRWDPGFTVGVAGEFKLNNYLGLRISPTMYFGSRHLTFRNRTDLDINNNYTETYQDLKSIYASAAIDLIYNSQRFNNQRPYILVGINPMLNLSAKNDDYIKLKTYDYLFEIGIGCDFYMPLFKLKPELKFCYSLINSLDTKHANDLKDKSMLLYTNSVKESRTKMIVLSFYFE
ncbi:type IX secretion/gliding motility protein PorT/SprT [Xylanibacter oryzae]|uniref:type IX secretion/gliding motility protein PorT/SprT n=1 Tax=Xylanibacter oryzae TaxID=185293 RepID=UPI0004B3849A|nr:porin family protein [Xylanibacter oryzae]